MIVYHGSNSNFKKLRIDKKLVKHDSTLLNEGLGIYFSTTKKVAESYGKFLYTLEINNKMFMDFRKKNVCNKYLMDIITYLEFKTGIGLGQILSYSTLVSIVEYMHTGGVAISGTCNEIALNLDASEKYYTNLSEAQRNRILKELNNYDKKHLKAYMFNYEIPNIGVIKDVGEAVVRIVNKETV